MRASRARPTIPWWQRVGLGIAAGALVVGCGSAATAVPATPSASPSASASAAVASGSPAPSVTLAPSASPSPTPSKGPATATFTFSGAKGLAGAVTKPAIRCGEPSFDGLAIDVFAQPADPAVLDRIVVTAGSVTVRVAAGAGTTYTERDFAGTGVAGFDPATGAQIDTKLSETTASGLHHGTLGAVTSLKGTIDCGGQTSGTSTLTLIGDIPEGHIDGPVSPANVRCAADGSNVSVIGLTQAGSTPVLLVISLGTDRLSVAAQAKGAATSRFYTTTTPGVASLVPGGAHADGDATAQNVAGIPPTIHVAGDASCG